MTLKFNFQDRFGQTTINVEYDQRFFQPISKKEKVIDSTVFFMCVLPHKFYWVDWF